LFADWRLSLAIAPHIRRCCPRLWFFFRSLRYWYWKGENEIHVLHHIVPRGRLALDVGSSIGLYSKELARLVPRVVAFEADPGVAALARRVAPRNVEVVNAALSAANGSATLRIPLNERGRPVGDRASIERPSSPDAGRFTTVEVATRRLDDCGYADCGFIKIDVEAHEEAVLDGAQRLIEACRPVLMIELDDGLNPGAIGRVTDRLSRSSYDGYFLSHGELRPMSEFDMARQQNIKAYMALPPRQRRDAEYINNFIFVPREAPLPRIARQDAAHGRRREPESR
jgi:FkbM family methyltransferase